MQGAIQQMMQMMNAQNMYLSANYPNPVEQFCSALEKRKFKMVNAPEVLALMDKIFVIKIALGRGAEEHCWRRFRVPASTSLNVLHDQIITPIMGWARAYHGYVFIDRRDGSVLGPAKYSGYIDMMHAAMHYHYVMDDRKIPLACLLREVGDACDYTYDLGDSFCHVLTVEEVADGGEQEGDQGVQLLAGHGACPPEDSNGLGDKGIDGYVELVEKYQRRPKSCKAEIREAEGSVNYRQNWLTGLPVPFRPGSFDLNFHRLMLSAMLAGPRVQKKGFVGFSDEVTEVTAGCARCGDRLRPLHKCARCRRAAYCGRECQKADWKEHKKVCATKKKP
ncbi:unnamed protein product [Heterosigma akashiwo]